MAPLTGGLSGVLINRGMPKMLAEILLLNMCYNRLLLGAGEGDAKWTRLIAL